jgi:LDH2 family malate/lactate/ureidoglycolate dehydrogenase
VHTNDLVVPHLELRAFARDLLEAARLPRDAAELMADSLIAANLRGTDSHGVQLLPLYVEAVEAGRVNPAAAGHVVCESGGCVLYDGENGVGHVVARRCSDDAVRLANEHGIGAVTVRESNHFGAAAFWTRRIADRGCIGMAMCNATPLVAPWQAKEPRLGTNPIAMSVPGPRTWELDMATTTVALNRIFKAANMGESAIPAGWAMDSHGVPTTDTQEAIRGLPMPLGGYKGTGLAVMAEILCAVLSGGAMTTEVGGMRTRDRPMRTGQFFLAIDVARFMPLDQFAARMTTLRESIKSAAPAAGYDEVLMAGDPEWRAEAQRLREGIPLGRPIWRLLEDLAARLKVPAPEVSGSADCEPRPT